MTTPRRARSRLISVGMPVFNGEKYLEAAIRAIQRQTVDDFELIISDNASTDRTAEICRDMASGDARITYHRNHHNVGAAGNFNTVFKHSMGRYFRWATADDEALPTLHAECLGVLEAHPSVVLTYAKAELIDSRGDFIRDYDDNLHLPYDRPSERFFALLRNIRLVNVHYGLMRSECVHETSLIRSSGIVPGDVRFLAELSLYGKFHEIPKRLFRRRMHSGASSSLPNDDSLREYYWRGTQSPVVLPAWRTWADFVGFAFRAPVSWREQRALLGHIARRAFWSRDELIRDVRNLLHRWRY